MWELNQNWTIMKAEHQRTDAFNSWCWRRLESPLDCKEIKPVHPKENQPWIFIGSTDFEAEAPILRRPDEEPTHSKRAWCSERLRAQGEEDDRSDGWMASSTQRTWVWANSLRYWRTGGLAYYSPWDRKESDMTEWLKNNNKDYLPHWNWLKWIPFYGWVLFHYI